MDEDEGFETVDGGQQQKFINEKFHEVDETEDPDLCAQCRRRERHLLLAAKQQEKMRQRELEAEDVVHIYNKRKLDEATETERKNLESKKQREQEIKEYNLKLAREKRQNEESERKLPFQKESAKDVQDAATAPSEFLMYKRPDTATVNREKQQAHKEELFKQIAEKREMEKRERDEELQQTNRRNMSSLVDQSSEESREKQRSVKNRLEYRKALDAQIMEKAALDRAEDRSGTWWMKQDEMTEKLETLQTDQTKRHLKQEEAVKNLENFMAKQREVEMAEKERRRQISAVMQGNVPELTQPETSGAISTSESKIKRQKEVEVAWQQASEERDQKFHALRKDQGGALLDQLKQYRRCRKCQKAIQNPDHKREDHVEDNILGSLDEEDLNFNGRQPGTKLKSRHIP